MKHIIFDLKGCSADLLDQREYVRMSVYQAVKIANAELIHLAAHKFDPQGVTCMAMLAESHMTMHTWPEKSMAKCDIFTCGETCLPELAIQYLGEMFKAEEVIFDTYDRDV